MSLEFHTFDPATGILADSPGRVLSYPSGEVRLAGQQTAPMNVRPVAWNHGARLDYDALAQWVSFQESTWEGGATPTLVLPFLPSARGDHDMTYDARSAARLTAATGIKRIITLDPHSPEWVNEAERSGVEVVSIGAPDLLAGSWLQHAKLDAVIAPDKGALRRAYEAADALKTSVLVAGKTRDSATGKLSGFVAPKGVADGERYLVVDDMVDGGGTFAGLAVEIRKTAPDVELHLFVSHGLFTGRWEENLSEFVTVTASTSDVAVAAPEEIAGASADIRFEDLTPHVVRNLIQMGFR